MNLTPLQRSLISGIAGFLIYGGWALAVNVSHGLTMGLRAGALQGSYSFFLTLGMTLVMEHLMMRFSHLAARTVLTVFIVSAVAFSVAYSIHWLNSTPEILLTILPGFLIGAIYSTIYVSGLQKLQTT